MKGKFLMPVLLVFLALTGVSFGADEALGGLCTVLEKVEGVAPYGVKGFAIVLLLGGIGVGGFFIIDRERGLMGRGIMVIALIVLVFVLIWNLAEPAQSIITGIKSAVGC